MKLTYSQIETLWINNGGSRAMAPIMAAIGLAESGGRTDALNTRAPDYSAGIWQINYFGALRPGRTKKFGSPEQLIADPNRQAKAAIAILKGQGLTAWSTYTNGAYKSHLDKSAKATPLPSLPSGGGAATPAASTGSVQTAALQQAGYDAVINLTPWGIPINPFKLPGWIEGQLGKAAGGAGTFAWDTLGPLVLATVGVVGGAALVIVGLSAAVRPITQSETGQIAQVAKLAV